jgi:hypothetical protein
MKVLFVVVFLWIGIYWFVLVWISCYQRYVLVCIVFVLPDQCLCLTNTNTQILISSYRGIEIQIEIKYEWLIQTQSKLIQHV